MSTPAIPPPARWPLEQPRVPYLERLRLEPVALAGDGSAKDEARRWWNASVENGRETIRPGQHHDRRG